MKRLRKQESNEKRSSFDSKNIGTSFDSEKIERILKEQKKRSNNEFFFENEDLNDLKYSIEDIFSTDHFLYIGRNQENNND